MFKPFIIGLLGFAGAGKDTVAKHLGFPTTAFAKSLKEATTPLATAAGLDLNKREDKEKFRDVLVAVGAGMRKIDPFFWVKKLDLSTDFPAITVTDVRYLNEVQHILFNGGMVVELIRPGLNPANDEEARSFGAIRDFLKERGLVLPVVYNREGKAGEAATAIKDEVYTVGTRMVHAVRRVV